MERISAQRAAEFVQVSLGAHTGELLGRNGGTLIQQPRVSAAASLHLPERLAVPLPELDVSPLLGLQTFVIPATGEQIVESEQGPDLGMLEIHAFEMAVEHVVKEGLERRASRFDTAFLEVALGDASLRFDQSVDTAGERGQVL